MKIILEAERLVLREMTQEDYPTLAAILRGEQAKPCTPTRARPVKRKRRHGSIKTSLDTAITIAGCVR